MYPPGNYQQPPPMDPRMLGQLEVKLSFFPLMWVLFLVSPSVAINGVEEQRKWGTHLWTLPAGPYTVEAWYPYLFRRRTSPARVMVNIVPGQVTCVSYRPSWLTFLDGTISFRGVRPALPPGPPMGY
jgi:hypothetical protein